MTDAAFSRRSAGRFVIASVVAGCAGPAHAQQGVVVAPALPCATHRDDIVSLLLDGSGASAGTVVTFGQVFRKGDLPRGASLTARRATAQALPVQADVKTRHADGSARFAVVCLAAPALRSGERLGVVLGRGAAAEAAPLDIVAAATGRSAIVEITPVGGGEAWQTDLLLRLQDAIVLHRGEAPWQSGPLAVEGRVRLKVPAAALGPDAAEMRLVADVALRSDGTLRCAVWLRNDIAMTRSGGAAHYRMRLLLDGRLVLESDEVRQFQYQAWGRTRGVARGGREVAAPFVRHDARYLGETGAVPRYDIAVGVEEALLARMAAAMAHRDWQAPMHPRGITQYMPQTGGRGDIGPATVWQAAWLVSGDPRAAAHAIGQAEAAGAVPWHFWDDANNTWLGTAKYPRLWTDPRGGTGRPGDARATGLTQQRPGRDVTGWTPDQAHTPDLSSVPYMLTGERWMLDNLQAQASAAVMGTFPETRFDGGGIVVNGQQVRASAWNLRQVENAAWLSPDGSAEQAYFETVSQKNWDWLISQVPAWTAQQGEVHGWVPGLNSDGTLRPWQQDYFASITILMTQRGRPEAARFLRWQSNFLLGRFRNEPGGFKQGFGVGYTIAMAPPNNPRGAPVFQTWAHVAEATNERNLVRSEWGTGNYNQLALATLAGMVSALQSQEAASLFAELSRRGLRGTAASDYRKEPTFNVTPPGVSRAGPGEARCTPSRPPG
ncbi:hypothetical protein [Elioraea sp.]|uniref:hypothetical protein n=1 Tax=Elioraea sp. TaxID=2185103 RepID=UPI0025B85E66|nr:hypothetical protein [Elioraea sp.]